MKNDSVMERIWTQNSRHQWDGHQTSQQMYIYVYIYIYIYMSISLSISLSDLSACVSVCLRLILLTIHDFVVISPGLCLFVTICIYIYVYIYMSQYIYWYEYTHCMNIYSAINFQHNALTKCNTNALPRWTGIWQIYLRARHRYHLQSLVQR